MENIDPIELQIHMLYIGYIPFTHIWRIPGDIPVPVPGGENLKKAPVRENKGKRRQGRGGDEVQSVRVVKKSGQSVESQRVG